MIDAWHRSKTVEDMVAGHADPDLCHTEKKDLIDSIKWEYWIFFNWIN